MRLTFTIPDNLARDLQSLVPSGERSSIIARLLKEELNKPRELLIKACHSASNDRETEKTVDEWQGFNEKIEGPSW